ncbi:MAG: hypothetical protein M3Q88_05175 [Pseudomonadota bacterium]|nr:hypothetical protein [Pseudomonadota bacterium]
MSREVSLSGTLIPRGVKRMFDQRGELRETAAATAVIEWRGVKRSVALANLSPSGAMLIFQEIPHIGERVTLRLPDCARQGGVVQWVRDGRIGIHFDAALG